MKDVCIIGLNSVSVFAIEWRNALSRSRGSLQLRLHLRRLLVRPTWPYCAKSQSTGRRSCR